jgi:hypothetical protein
MRGKAILALFFGVSVVTVSIGTKADTPESTTRRAAAAFDDGVARFKRADYEGAAKAFLVADELVPNAQAITNALAAARKANDFLAVADAAQRALSRGETGTLGTSAREALAEAATRLSAVEATCDPAPCTLSIDGTRIAAGRKYLLPGTHDVAGERPDGARALEHLSTVAGATYRVALHPELRSNVTPPPISPAGGAATSIAPSTPATAASGSTAPLAGADNSSNKRMSPTVFYVGVGASAILVALTTWSGVDTLAALHKHDDNAPDYDPDSVRNKMHRTDALLAATVLVGATTGYLGWKLVNWAPAGGREGPAVSVSVRPTPFGGGLVGLARF